jgi:hypothetical protein
LLVLPDGGADAGFICHIAIAAAMVVLLRPRQMDADVPQRVPRTKAGSFSV